MKKLILLLFIPFVFGCDKLKTPENGKNELEEINAKALSLSISANELSESKNYIKKNNFKIKIPKNWKVWSEEEMQSYLFQSKYPGNLDYWLTLANKKIDSYPRISLLLQKLNGQDKFLGFNDLITILDQGVPYVLENTERGKSISDFKWEGNYIDNTNQIMYLVSVSNVTNLGKEKSIAAIHLSNDYMVSITLSCSLNEFETHRSAFQTMVNSIVK